MVFSSIVVLSVWLFVLPAKAQVDTQYIPDSAIGAVVVHPKHVSSLESLELLPWEVATAAGLQQFGIDPLQIDQVIAVLDQPDFESEPGVGCIVRLANATALGGELFRYVDPQPYRGCRLYEIGPGVAIVEINPRTFLFGTEEMLEKMMQAKDTDSPLTRLMGSQTDPDSLDVFMMVAPVRELLNEMASEIEVPPEFEQFRNLPNMVESFHLRQNLKSHGSRLVISASEGKAQELSGTLNHGLKVGKELLLGELTNSMDSSDPVQLATLSWARRIGDHFEKQLTPEVNGNELVFDASYGVASAPILVALLLPAVQQVRGAARRTESANKLRMMILSMHNYHDANKKLPSNHYSRIPETEARPLLSWRVQILPYIEQGALYDQFRMDEPWDSEHNIRLVEQMPNEFVSPDVELEPGLTIFQAVTGGDAVFNGDDRRKTLERIMDGTSRTIGIVEANPDRAVVWTKPDDFKVDWESPMNGLGGIRPEGFNAAFFDGSVRLIQQSIDLRTLSNLFNCRDGEVPLDY